MTDRTVHSNRRDMVILNKTIKEEKPIFGILTSLFSWYSHKRDDRANRANFLKTSALSIPPPTHTHIKVSITIILSFPVVNLCGPVQRLSTDWTVRGSNPCWGGERNFPHPSRLVLGPPSLLYSRYRVSCPGVKLPGRGVDHPPPTQGRG